MHVQVSEVHGVFGNFANYVEFICDQSRMLKQDERAAHAHAEPVYFRMLIETSKPYSLGRSKVVKVSSESCYSCHLEHLSDYHNQQYNRLFKSLRRFYVHRVLLFLYEYINGKKSGYAALCKIYYNIKMYKHVEI